MMNIFILVLIFICTIHVPIIAQQQSFNHNSPFGINLSAIDPWESDWTFVNIAHHALAWHPVIESISSEDIIPQKMLTPPFAA